MKIRIRNMEEFMQGKRSEKISRGNEKSLNGSERKESVKYEDERSE